jgi:hypothetical protein
VRASSLGHASAPVPSSLRVDPTHHGLGLAPRGDRDVVERRAEHKRDAGAARTNTPQAVAVVEEDGDQRLCDTECCSRVGCAWYVRLAARASDVHSIGDRRGVYLMKTGFPASVSTKYCRGRYSSTEKPVSRMLGNVIGQTWGILDLTRGAGLPRRCPCCSRAWQAIFRDGSALVLYMAQTNIPAVSDLDMSVCSCSRSARFARTSASSGCACTVTRSSSARSLSASASASRMPPPVSSTRIAGGDGGDVNTEMDACDGCARSGGGSSDALDEPECGVDIPDCMLGRRDGMRELDIVRRVRVRKSARHVTALALSLDLSMLGALRTAGSALGAYRATAHASCSAATAARAFTSASATRPVPPKRGACWRHLPAGHAD